MYEESKPISGLREPMAIPQPSIYSPIGGTRSTERHNYFKQ